MYAASEVANRWVIDFLSAALGLQTDGLPQMANLRLD